MSRDNRVYDPKEYKKKPTEFRTYNRYNIYFTLEREKLVLSKGGVTKWSTMDKAKSASKQPVRHGYENLNLPPFPPRFAYLNVPEDWCVAGRRHLGEKRSHVKTHGVVSFREIARTIADRWKAVDSETLEWCMKVEKILKLRHAKLKAEEREMDYESRAKEASNAYRRGFQAARARQQLFNATRPDPARPAVHQLQVTKTRQQLPPTPIFSATHFGATRMGHLAAASGTSAYNNNEIANSGNRNHRHVSQSEISRAVSGSGTSNYNNNEIANSGNHRRREVSQSEISRAASGSGAIAYNNGTANSGNHNHRDLPQSEMSRAFSGNSASAYKIGAATVIMKHSTVSPQPLGFSSEHINNARIPLPLGWKASVDQKSGKTYYYRRPAGEPDPNSLTVGKVPAATEDYDGNDVNGACSLTGIGSSTNANSSRDTVTHLAIPPYTTITHPSYKNSSVNASNTLLPPGWKSATDRNSGNIFYYRYAI